jgi:hypothetical protein
MNRNGGVSSVRRTGPRQPLSVSKTELPKLILDPSKRSKPEVDTDHGLWDVFYSKDKPMNTPEEGHEPPIYRLHPELVQYLARNFLDLFETALLALCSETFRYLLGAQYWQIFLRRFRAKEQALFVWEREFPEMVHCVPCAKFHHINATPYVVFFLEMSVFRTPYTTWRPSTRLTQIYLYPGTIKALSILSRYSKIHQGP